MAVFEELPEELKMLILSKLPAKSLLRFKCVQKSWYSLIKSPRFTHLHRSSSSSSTSSSLNYDCFLVNRFIEQQKQNVLSLHSYETLDDLGYQFIFPFSNRSFRAWLCGSCDGLVCASDYEDRILICNPTIQECRSLSFPRSLHNRPAFRIESVAFGSDPNTGQYKVVMIGVPVDYDEDGKTHFGDREARSYDFSTDTWRKTAAVVPRPFNYSRNAISFNGAFHWCPWDNSKSILTFCISNEVTEFEFIPLPDFVHDFHQKVLCVSTKSQLALILHGVNGLLEICVMKEYGVKESWTKLFNVKTGLVFYQPIVFWDEHQLLIRTEQGQLVSCDLQNQTLQNQTFRVWDFELYPISQSLVSVNGIGHPII